MKEKNSKIHNNFFKIKTFAYFYNTIEAIKIKIKGLYALKMNLKQCKNSNRHYFKLSRFKACVKKGILRRIIRCTYLLLYGIIIIESKNLFI